MYRRKRIIGSGAVAMLATILAPFGSSTASSASTTSTIAEPSPGFTSTQADLTQGCTPAVMVVRHAEDEANPLGGADILSAVGKKHAALYPDLFRKYLAEPHSIGPDRAEVTVCPIGKIIAIDPKGNTVNPSPSSNPYDTIKPLADYLNLPIQVTDPAGVPYSTVYNWDTPERLKTLLENGSSTPTSTVIAWDKQGLNPSADDLSTKSINNKKLGTYGFVPLLKALPTNQAAIVGSGTYAPAN